MKSPRETHGHSYVIQSRVSPTGVRRTTKSKELASELRFKIADSFTHLYDAFRLLQNRYQSSGLATSRAPIRVEPFHLWPQSHVFVALDGDSVEACLTLIEPGHPEGLPLEQLYPQVTSYLPDHASVAEATSFAIAPNSAWSSWRILTGLVRAAQCLLLAKGVEYAVAVVHPKHARSYQRSLGFRVVGEEFPCERVGGNPGIALIGKTDHIDDCRIQWREQFVVENAKRNSEETSDMSSKQRIFFEQYLVPDQTH